MRAFRLLLVTGVVVLAVCLQPAHAGKAGHSSLQYLSKKQWHVSNFANKVKVWKAEARAEKKEKERLLRIKAREEQLHLQQLKALSQRHSNSTDRSKAERMEWMYGPGDFQGSHTHKHTAFRPQTNRPTDRQSPGRGGRGGYIRAQGERVGTGRDGWERGFGVGFGVREQGEGTVEEAPRGCAETKDACSRMLERARQDRLQKLQRKLQRRKQATIN